MFSDRRDSMTNPDATRMLLVAIAVVTPFAGDVIEAHQFLKHYDGGVEAFI